MDQPTVATLDQAAPAQAGQPVAQADPGMAASVQPTNAELGIPEAIAPAGNVPAEPPVAAAPPRLFAGKYLSEDELEKGYLQSQSEATRLAMELAEARKQPATQAGQSGQPQKSYTPEQLANWRIQYEQERTDALLNGNRDAAMRCAQQIALIDNEYPRLQAQQFFNQNRSQQAQQSLLQQGAELLKPYASDLHPGNPLYAEAQALHEGFRNAFEVQPGSLQEQILGGLAVLAAVQKRGVPTQQAATQARQQLAHNLTQNLKQGVIAGAGGAAPQTSTAPNFGAMSDADFVKWQASQGFAQ